MTTIDAMLERLSQLSRRDRQWLLRNLSTEARAVLGQHAASATVAAPTPNSDVPLHEELALDALAPEVVAAELAAQPSWVLAMILSLRSWRWEEALLERTPPVTRLELMQLRSSLPPVSAAMHALVVRTLRARFLPAAGTQLPFEAVLERAQQRAPGVVVSRPAV
jgi:hypothetical protein